MLFSEQQICQNRNENLKENYEIEDILFMYSGEKQK